VFGFYSENYIHVRQQLGRLPLKTGSVVRVELPSVYECWDGKRDGVWRGVMHALRHWQLVTTWSAIGLSFTAVLCSAPLHQSYPIHHYSGALLTALSHAAPLPHSVRSSEM